MTTHFKPSSKLETYLEPDDTRAMRAGIVRNQCLK